MSESDRERKNRQKNWPSQMKRVKRWAVCPLCHEKYPTRRGHICKKRKG